MTRFTLCFASALAWATLGGAALGQDDEFYEAIGLGAWFHMEHVPYYGGSFYGARIVTAPEVGSPLHGGSLRAGDVISRLDGTRVTCFDELENHKDWTTVRYYRAGRFYTTSIYVGRIQVRPGRGVMIAN